MFQCRVYRAGEKCASSWLKADILREILDLKQLAVSVLESGLILSGFSDADPVFALHFMNVLAYVDVELSPLPSLLCDPLPPQFLPAHSRPMFPLTKGKCQWHIEFFSVLLCIKTTHMCFDLQLYML